MNFGDVEFIALFLPLVWAAHGLLPRRAAAQNALLVAASYAFFASWSPPLLVTIVASTLAHYGLVRAMRRSADERARGRVFALGVALSLGQLVAFKYLGFFAETANAAARALGGRASLPVVHFVLPVGISFWTLQQLSWLADVRDERDPGDATLLEYAAWVAFFPRLVSGPIVRGRELLPQLRAARGLRVDDLGRGAARFFRGFVAKYLIAATVGATLVDPVFAAPDHFTRASHWAALAGYAAQVYADFAGYSEMALGCAALFGLTLPENFNHPFFARSMLEFWRRWHMTLTSWLFDYIYSPLVTGGGRLRGRLDLGFLVVFAVSGLWHGATWAFVAWGALHGAALAVHRRWDELYRGLCRRDRAWVARRKTVGYLAGAWAVTQGFFLVSLVPFRAATLPAAGAFARGLVVARGAAAIDVGSSRNLQAIVVSLGLLAGWELLHLERLRPALDRLRALPAPVRGLAYGALAAYLALFMPLTGAAFIYAQF